MKHVSARQANQDFSKLLAEAAAGEEIVITRRGVAVAKLGPVGPEEVSGDRRAAVERLCGALDLALGNVRFNRDELHER
jgi:prevent-host-death family protein